ncbi:hypothetical protein ACFCZ3_20050 [Cellulosimicrobium cellulans]|uniref:hypothetical protein n=1 Tax=Cellulosimicrobium cellulans TaxID=1710 RepID=UPI0035D90F30
MSAATLVTIMCDAPSCGRWEDAGIAETALRARQGLAGTGWTLGVSVRDGMLRDYCPKHAPSHTAQAANDDCQACRLEAATTGRPACYLHAAPARDDVASTAEEDRQ